MHLLGSLSPTLQHRCDLGAGCVHPAQPSTPILTRSAQLLLLCVLQPEAGLGSGLSALLGEPQLPAAGDELSMLSHHLWKPFEPGQSLLQS